MDLAVNHLPVLTWNRLDLNKADVKVSDGLLFEKPATPEKLPEGVAIKGEVSEKELCELFSSLGISNPAENVVAGKFPMYNKQSFGTGMGADVDLLMKDAGVRVLTVEENASPEKPLKLLFRLDEGMSGLDDLFIHAKAGSDLALILQYVKMPGKCEYLELCGRCDEQKELADAPGSKEHKGVPDGVTPLMGVRTRVYLEKGAKLHLSVVQMLDEGTQFLHDIGGFLETESKLRLTKIDLGSYNVYEGLNVLQSGDDSSFEADLGYLGQSGSNLDLNYNDVFLGKNGSGRMYFKEALLDDAKKTFRGTVDFRFGSTGSKGDEQEDVILLGDDVVNRTIPLILCEEEDVDGRHAATIGSLSPDMLFYMQTRGISERKAKELMVRSALMHISQMVPSDSIKKAVQNHICRIFE